ncbi:ribose 5-phosphate isomerase B [Deltaproteobacteria bacterium PRO3]|nr:ribose 5-phosphate isomerase B [Deltaproteobacteria bacterium PRO3]
MKLAIASDHGGFHLKKAILRLLDSRKIEYVDLGVTSEDSVDYPDYAAQVAQRVAAGQADGGILLCGTGIGMAITANKFKGIRAAVVTDPYTAQMSKEHNDSNVIALGGRVLDEPKAEATVQAWLDAKFQAGRHERRLEKIGEIENKNFK